MGSSATCRSRARRCSRCRRGPGRLRRPARRRRQCRDRASWAAACPGRGAPRGQSPASCTRRCSPGRRRRSRARRPTGCRRSPSRSSRGAGGLRAGLLVAVAVVERVLVAGAHQSTCSAQACRPSPSWSTFDPRTARSGTGGLPGTAVRCCSGRARRGIPNRRPARRLRCRMHTGSCGS